MQLIRDPEVLDSDDRFGIGSPEDGEVIEVGGVMKVAPASVEAEVGKARGECETDKY